MSEELRGAIENWKNIRNFNVTPENVNEVYNIVSDNTPTIINFGTGDFVFKKTLVLGSNKWIRGMGENLTRLILEKNSDCHLFTNSKNKITSDLFFSDFSVDGNLWNQKKPEECKTIVFANAFYFKDCKDLVFNNIRTDNIRQTGLHFCCCSSVVIDNFNAKNLGWSGISTSGTNNIRATNFNIINSGLDVMHSGIHLDGGHGAYLVGTVNLCTGNGIMIDSAYRSMRSVYINATVSNSKRGVSLSGSVTNFLEDVYISGKYFNNREIGIMVSNSDHVFINECSLIDNLLHGVLLQGRQGGRYTTIVNCQFTGNGSNVTEQHGSKDNFFIIQGHSKKNEQPIATFAKNVNLPIKENDHEQDHSYSGPCHVCGKIVTFIKKHQFLREGYRCPSCLSSLRHRGQAAAIISCFPASEASSIEEIASNPDFHELNIYEPGIIGPFEKYFCKFPFYRRSYFWEDIKTGEFKNGIQCQNLEEITFENDSFDLLISSDIFEHIRRPWVAFKEVFRVLKEGGYHVFTIPVQIPMKTKTVYRVNTENENDVFLMEARYHIAGDGDKSLVYTEFGKDIEDQLKEIGFEVEIIQLAPSIEQIAPLITFKTRKPPKPQY